MRQLPPEGGGGKTALPSTLSDAARQTQGLGLRNSDPLFGKKKTVENWILPVFDRFWPKRSSNVVLFKF